MIRRHALLLLFFLLLAGLSLYQLLFHSNSHMAGEAGQWNDYYNFNWNMWWVQQALSTEAELYSTNYVMFPHSTNLSLHTLVVGWYPLWALLTRFVDSFNAFALIFVGVFTLTGYLSYLLLRREGAARPYALLGAAALEFMPMLAIAVWWNQLNLLGWFWLPIQLLLWGQVARNAQRPWRACAWALLQGLALWWMLHTDLQYLMFAAFLMLPYSLLTLWEARRFSARGTLIMAGLLALGLCLALSWLAGPLPALLDYDRSQLISTPLEANVNIDLPEGYLSARKTYEDGLFLGLFLPLGVLGGALILAWRKPRDWRAWFWLGLALPPFLLSFGQEIPALYRPFYEALGGTARYPDRLGVVALFPAAIFAARAWSYLPLKGLGRYLLVALLLPGLMWHQEALEPLAIQPRPTHYDFYVAMGQENYDYVVVEVPTAAGDGVNFVGDAFAIALQYYGTIHGKRMINGHFSRTPVSNYYYLRSDHPLLSWLGQRRLLEPERVEPLLAQMIADYPIGYFVIHQEIIGLEQHANNDIIGYFNQLDHLLCPPSVEQDAVLYRTRWHPDGCASRRTPPELAPGHYHIDIGRPGDEAFLGWGWYWREQIFDINLRWTGFQPTASLYVDLPPGSYEVTLLMQAFEEARPLRLLLNDSEVGRLHVEAGQLQPFSVTLPAALVGDGQHLELRLELGETRAGTAPRPLALALESVTFMQQ